jgi:hypothetical protein
MYTDYEEAGKRKKNNQSAGVVGESPRSQIETGTLTYKDAGNHKSKSKRI